MKSTIAIMQTGYDTRKPTQAIEQQSLGKIRALLLGLKRAQPSMRYAKKQLMARLLLQMEGGSGAGDNRHIAKRIGGALEDEIPHHDPLPRPLAHRACEHGVSPQAGARQGT